MIQKIEHAGIRTGDIERSVRFYRDVLGFSLRERVDLGEVRLAFLKVGESEIELIQGSTPPEREEGVIGHLAFTVDDIEAVVSRLKAAGVELIDAAPREALSGCRIFFFLGPDGEKLELFQRPEP